MDSGVPTLVNRVKYVRSQFTLAHAAGIKEGDRERKVSSQGTRPANGNIENGAFQGGGATEEDEEDESSARHQHSPGVLGSGLGLDAVTTDCSVLVRISVFRRFARKHSVDRCRD